MEEQKSHVQTTAHVYLLYSLSLAFLYMDRNINKFNKKKSLLLYMCQMQTTRSFCVAQSVYFNYRNAFPDESPRSRDLCGVFKDKQHHLVNFTQNLPHIEL